MFRRTHGFKRTFTSAAFLAALALSLGANISAEPDEQTRLVSLLESLPNPTTVLPSDPDAPPLVLYYANLRAAERASGASSPESLEAFTDMNDSEFSRWSAAISRVHGFNLPQEVSSEVLARAGVPGIRNVFRQFPELLGVDWFSIDQLAEFGQPPHPVVVALGTVSSEATESAAITLERNGFEQSETSGITQWQHFADLETQHDFAVPADITGRRRVDPFGIATGQTAGLLIADGRLAGSDNTALVETTAATWSGDLTALHASPEFRAGLFALTDPERYSGQLIQAFLTTVRFPEHLAAIRRLGPYSTQEQREAYLDQLKRRIPPGVPAYELIVLADRQEGSTEITVLGLVYHNEQAARDAVSGLPELFDSFEPIHYGARLVATENLRQSTRVHAGSSNGPYVALIEFHRRLTEHAESTRKPGKIYGVLREAMASGVFEPLIVFE